MDDAKGSAKTFEAYYANLPDGVTAFTVGTKVKITGKLMKYVNANNGNVICEMKNPTVQILEDDGGGGGTTTDEGTPVTCAQAVELTNDLADGGTSTETYTVTGYITQVVGDVSKNQQTFWMADTKDGGKVFEAYWANLPEGVSAFTVGMKVKITGKLMKYVNKTSGQVTPEIKNATVVILEDDGGGGGTTDEEIWHKDCASAIQLTLLLDDNATSEETYAITGYITEVIGAVSTKTGSPQQSFWMSDSKDGGQDFEAYYANLPEGVSEFQVGMKVEVTGKLQKYVKNGQITPEIKNGTVVILEDAEGHTTEAIPVTCAELIEQTNLIENNSRSEFLYEVTGYITEVLGAASQGRQSFWMDDTKDGGLVVQASGASIPSGITEFQKGMKVKIKGHLYKEVTTDGTMIAQIELPTVVILENVDGGGGGETLTELVNGGFEKWASDTEATGWMASGSAAPGNAILSKSSDAHDGSFACLVGAPGSMNKRLATQKMTLEAGSYTFSFYAKSTTPNVCQTRGGYAVFANGTVPSNGYHYASYADINNNGWTLVSYDFELTETTELSLLVMNPKNSTYSVSQDILIDDATLVKK